MGKEADAIQEKAIEVLTNNPNGLSYRELVAAVSVAMPEITRDTISSAIGNLPKDRGDAVWRPKPGHFKIRGLNEGPTTYARGRKRKSVASPAEEKKPIWPARPLPNRIENLVKLGFTEAGYWVRTGDGIECALTTELDPKRSLVAYVVADSVVYIGRPNQSRSGYVSRSVRNALAKDRQVRVFALSEWEPCTHSGMQINVAAGIEDELIERMQPPWNNFPA